MIDVGILIPDQQLFVRDLMANLETIRHEQAVSTYEMQLEDLGAKMSYVRCQQCSPKRMAWSDWPGLVDDNLPQHNGTLVLHED